MGFTPQQVNLMSLYQFQAAIDGYVEAHSSDEGTGKLSENDVNEIWDWMQDRI